MFEPTTVVPRLLTLLAACLLIGAVSVAAAQADPFGELHNFGEAELKGTAVPEKALGVDPETGDVYAVVESSAKKFTLSQFVSSGGAYKVAASVTFQPADPSGEGDEIEGVAIDSKLHRAYLLVDETRKAGTLDPEKQAAAAIYAFSTIASGTKLVTAVGVVGEKLVSPTVLQPTSKEPGVSLIDPGGIAVDPANDEIVLAASVDQDLNGLNEEGEQEEEEFTSVIQRISSSGTLGARYLAARTNATNPNCGCLGSPVVSQAGTVYVLGEQSEILEFPTPSTTKVAPETVPVNPVVKDKFNFDCEKECRFGSSSEEFDERLLAVEEEVSSGSALSISPEGDIWAYARVKYQLGGSAGEFSYGGAVEFNPEFDEIGWTGGQSVAAATGKCVIDDLVERPAIAAGPDGVLFALDRSPANTGEGESEGPHVIEFGVEGEGCPHGQGEIEASAGGESLTEDTTVPEGEAVTFTTPLLQANALSTEWEFEPGVKQTVNKREQEQTRIEHKFTGEGELTIKETIHTDNLATPTIVLERKIHSVASGNPTVVTSSAQVTGTTVKMKGTVDPNSLTHKIEECFFEYGPTTKYGSTAACTPVLGTGLEAKEVTATVTGLAKHSEYHFRLVAKGVEKSEGADKTFVTGPSPAVSSGTAGGVGQTTATISGSVNPEGANATSCQLEYGTSPSYGSTVACPTAPGAGEAAVAEPFGLSGLSSNTTYDFRIVAANSGGTTYGVNGTFTTTAEVGTGPGNNTGSNSAAEEAQRKAEAEAAQRKAQEEAAKKHAEEEAVAKKKHEEEEKAKSKPLTRSQLLAKALKTCLKEPKKKRAKCEASAKKKYDPKAKGHKKKHK
jgi:hypothetical protein